MRNAKKDVVNVAMPGWVFLLLISLCSSALGSTMGVKTRKVCEVGWDLKAWAFLAVVCLYLGLMCWVVKLTCLAQASRPTPASEEEWERANVYWKGAYWKVLYLTSWPIVFAVVPEWLPDEQWIICLSILLAGGLTWAVMCWRLVRGGNRARWPERYPVEGY